MAAASMTAEFTFTLSMTRKAFLPHPVPIDSLVLLKVFGFVLFSFVCLIEAAYFQRLADTLYQKEKRDGIVFGGKERRSLAIRNNLFGLLPLIGFAVVVRGL
jgi:hypothetical protein